jgi:hypothetical protein
VAEGSPNSARPTGLPAPTADRNEGGRETARPALLATFSACTVAPSHNAARASTLTCFTAEQSRPNTGEGRAAVPAFSCTRRMLIWSFGRGGAEEDSVDDAGAAVAA